MAKALPPLSALLAFEAVARRLSFSRAAEELHVTPGAVSQQVRSLEELLGHTLFERTSRSVVLTGAARRMLPDVQVGLQALSRVTDPVIPTAAERSLTISVAPSFASKWLLPRLPAFSERHPEIELRISATAALDAFGADGPDVAIRFGHGNYGGLQVEKLLAESVTPMCSPRLLARGRRLEVPEDLRKFRLLHDASIPGDATPDLWKLWLALAGEGGVATRGGMRFTLAEHALQAAIDGAGVVLGRIVLAGQDLAEGLLVRPFALALPLEAGYFLVRPRRRRDREEIRCFREWLLSEAARQVDSPPRLARAPLRKR